MTRTTAYRVHTCSAPMAGKAPIEPLDPNDPHWTHWLVRVVALGAIGFAIWLGVA